MATIYAAPGIDHGLELRDGQGRPHALCAGRPARSWADPVGPGCGRRGIG